MSVRGNERLLSGRATKGSVWEKRREENLNVDDVENLLLASFHRVVGQFVRLGLQEGVPPVQNLGLAAHEGSAEGLTEGRREDRLSSDHWVEGVGRGRALAQEAQVVAGTLASRESGGG